MRTVLTSDLRRAVATAEIAFAGTSIPVHQDVRLRECDYGDLNGCPVQQVAAKRRRRIDTPYPGGQSYRQVVAATADLLADLLFRWNGARVLLIAHRANHWALEHLVNGAALADLVGAPFQWREGWTYTLPDGWGADT